MVSNFKKATTEDGLLYETMQNCGQGTIGERVLVAKDRDGVVALVESNSLEVEDEIDDCYIYNTNLYEKDFVITHRFDSNKNVFYTIASAVIYSAEKEVAVADFAQSCRKLINDFMFLFNVNMDVPYHIIDKNGISNGSREDEDFGAILNDGAHLILEVRESATSFWVFTIAKHTETEIYCTIEHYVNDEETKDYIGDVNLDL